jgi:RelE-like toxin of type II toxin-antitoxin system HigB
VGLAARVAKNSEPKLPFCDVRPKVPLLWFFALSILYRLPERLQGDRKGQHSIRINDQWRICFEWPEGSPGPINVEITDYH